MRTTTILGSIATLAALATVALGVAHADEVPAVPKNQVSVSFTGFAGFLRVNAGSFVFGYERKLDLHHAVRLAGDFVHVHHNADHVQAHQWTYGGSLGYRYHLHPEGGMFLGLEVGYRRGHGHYGHYGHRDAADHTMLENQQLRVLPELGVRLPHRRLPLVFVTRIAAGWGPYDVTTDRDDAVGAAAAQYAQDVLAATPLVVDVEVSLAYAF